MTTTPVRRPARVLVFGAGLGGLAAGLRALELGAQVTVFEKAAAPGGSTVLSGGLLWTVPDLRRAQQYVPDGNPTLQAVVCEQVSAGHAWLRGHGVAFASEHPEERFAHNGWGDTTMTGHSFEPQTCVDLLVRRIQERGGRIELERSLERIRTDGGRVSGAVVSDADGATEGVPADAVVLATGGFQGNTALLAQHVLPRPDGLYLRSAAWSTGDGLLAGLDAGAALSPGMHTFYGHAMPAPPAQVTQSGFSEMTQGYGQGCVALNLRGERFADETSGTGEEVLNQALARQEQSRGYYVLDAELLGQARAPGKPVNQVAIDRALHRGARVVHADTLEELAAGMEAGFQTPGHRVLATLTAYNQGTSAAGLVADGIARGKFWQPLVRPPFVALAVQASITMTMGGLAVDDSMRVLRRSASTATNATCIDDAKDFREVPVPGLLAAGADIGNVSNLNYLGGLATALTTGLVAGASAAGVRAG